MSAPDLETSPIARLERAEAERRRRAVRWLGRAFAALTTLVVLQLSTVGVSWLPPLSSAVAALGFVLAVRLARSPSSTSSGPLSSPDPAAALLVATMLVQHVLVGLSLPRTEDVGVTMMFSALCPLIGAATMRPRGTVLTALASFLAVLLVVATVSARGVTADEARSLPTPLFFVVVAGAVGIMLSLATASVHAAQLEDARAIVAARSQAASAEQRFRIIADQVSDLVGVMDAGGRYTFASDSYRRILGVAADKIVGEPSTARVHPDDQDAHAAALRATLEGAPCESITRIQVAAGQYRGFHVRLLRVDIEGRPHVAMTARDITELQLMNAELESARRMEALGRLAGGVAHDFNNLLSVIGSCAAMVRLTLNTPGSRAQSDLAVIEDAVERAARLTGQLLAFARRQVLPNAHTIPAEEIRRLVPLLERALGDRIELAVQTHGSRWQSPMSAGQLEQVVLNLAANARDAMPEGGRVEIAVFDREVAEGTVSALAPGGYVVVEVRDHGGGVPEEIRTTIFEPFFTTKAPGKGTGLGLATSFGIARQLGGTIELESEVGRGSTFRVFVPRSKAEHAAAVADKAAPSGPRSLEVLVLDDEPWIGTVISRMLATRGHRAVAVTDPREAMEQARNRTFDVILTDVVLGKSDGLEVLAELQRLRPSAGVVVMSGFSPSPERLGAVAATGVAFLPKPFSIEALVSSIEEAARSRATA